MQIEFRKKFEKEYKKLPKKLQEQFAEKLEMLKEDMFNRTLNIHSLAGDKKGLKSMNVSGDYRAWFKRDKDLITFYSIGNHSTLYR